MNLGEVEGETHLPVSLVWRDVVTNAKSSRRGKEEIKLKIFESGTAERIRGSDLRVEKRPCNWTREISWLSCRTETRIKWLTLPRSKSSQ